jgi:hypothetical protein
MGRIYAGVLGLTAFVTLLFRGLLAGSDGANQLAFAAGMMFLFAGIGWMIGTIAEQTVFEAAYKTIEKEVAAAKTEHAKTTS